MAHAGRSGKRDYQQPVYLLPVMHPGECDLLVRGLVGAADLGQGGTQPGRYLLVGCAARLVQDSMPGRGVCHYDCSELGPGRQ